MLLIVCSIHSYWILTKLTRRPCSCCRVMWNFHQSLSHVHLVMAKLSRLYEGIISGDSRLWHVYKSQTGRRNDQLGSSNARMDPGVTIWVWDLSENLSFNDIAIKTHKNTAYLHRWKFLSAPSGHWGNHLLYPLEVLEMRVKGTKPPLMSQQCSGVTGGGIKWGKLTHPPTSPPPLQKIWICQSGKLLM